MSSANNNISKDERALEALLAAAFRLDFPEDISDEQAEKVFQEPAQLSLEDKEVISSWGTDFIEKLINGKRTTSEKQQQDVVLNKEFEEAISAMNRDEDGNDIDDETRKKIEEERKKAIEEEENKDDEQSNES